MILLRKWKTRVGPQWRAKNVAIAKMIENRAKNQGNGIRSVEDRPMEAHFGRIPQNKSVEMEEKQNSAKSLENTRTKTGAGRTS